MKKLLITLLFLMPFISKAQFTYDVTVNSFVMNIVGVTDLSMNVTSTNYGYAVWGQDIRFDGFTTSTIKFHPDQIRNINGATVPQPTTATRIVEILDSVIAALPTGSATDTTSLSNRINLKLNIADTVNIRPQLVAGSNISITGTYPSLTIAASGGGGAYDSTLMATQYRLDTVKAKMVRITDIGSTVQSYNANTTTLGNTTSGTGSTILLSGSPAITTPSIAAITVSGGTLTLPTGSSATLMRTSDTTGKFVTGAYRKTASDSVFVIKGGAGVFAFRDSIGSGGGSSLDSSIFRRTYVSNALTSTLQSLRDQTGTASSLELATDRIGIPAFTEYGWISAPTGTASKTTLFFDATGRMAWRNGTGFLRTFDATGITADRVYTLPNATTTLAGLAVAQTFSQAQNITPPQLTVSSATSALTIVQDGNTTGNPDVLNVDLTGTTGSTSNLFNFKSAGVSQLKLDKSGNLTGAGGAGILSGFANCRIDGAGTFQFASNRSRIAGSANGEITLSNAAQDNFIKLNFGVASASFPALKRSTTTLQVRLADDSGFTAIESLYERFGSGSPEGVVTAPIGAVYHRTDGGAGTSFYVKESGTGNTGWVAK